MGEAEAHAEGRVRALRMENELHGYYRSPNGGLYHILRLGQRLTVRNVYEGEDVLTNLSPDLCNKAIQIGQLTRIHAPVSIEEREEAPIA